MSYYDEIAKAVIGNADEICDAIDRYLAKADDDLEKTLKKEGYVKPKESVKKINEVEETVADILQSQTDELVTVLRSCEDDSDWGTAEKKIIEMLDGDDVAERTTEVIQDMFEVTVPDLASVYIQESDGDLVVECVRRRTSDWWNRWSDEAGQNFHKSTRDSIEKLINDAVKNGEGIAVTTRKILDGGWRNEYYQAKRVAVTEVLRAHSVAHEEAIQQSPVVDMKEWRHTGSHKNKPRSNHVAMDGQIVPKDEPFVLIGRDGGTYYPMFPRDSLLPASESVNCHCIHRGIVNDDVLGKTYEERKKMQEDIINADNGKFDEEINEKNKAEAGISPYNVLDNFKEKTREAQVKYIGGKSKMALYDAGLIDNEDMLKKVKASTLQKLREDGIFTVNSSSIKHSTVGGFSNVANTKKPAGGANGGNMNGGGHSQANMDELTSRGIEYRIENTYDNGVRVGGVANHTEPEKRLGQSGQAWFPESWDSDKTASAGARTANVPGITEELHDVNGNLTGYMMYQKVDDVTVGVITDTEHNIRTIFPDSIQREVGD